MAYRWKLFYGIFEKSQQPGFFKILSVSFVGVFFNNFLPSTIGGDAYRTFHMSLMFPEGGMSRALSIVYIDRVVGLLGMGLLGLVSLILGMGEIALPSNITGGIVLLFAGLIIGLVFSITPRFHTFVLSLLAVVLGGRGKEFQRKVALLFTRLAAYCDRFSLLMTALSLSVFLRIVWIYGCYVVALSLGVDVPFSAFLVVVPLIELLRMLPVTFQGIGVREGLFIFFFGYYGVSPSDATLLAIIIYLLLNVNGIVGGILFFCKQKINFEEMAK
jgi:hypothetical protein